MTTTQLCTQCTSYSINNKHINKKFHFQLLTI